MGSDCFHIPCKELDVNMSRDPDTHFDMLKELFRIEGANCLGFSPLLFWIESSLSTLPFFVDAPGVRSVWEGIIVEQNSIDRT